MEAPAEPTEETKHSRGFGRYVFWAGVILLVYVLSFGPVLMMAERGEQTCIILLVTFYSPIDWVCYNTPLRQPIGMYLHLWCPEMFDNVGNPTRHRDRNDDLAVAGNLSIGQAVPKAKGLKAHGIIAGLQFDIGEDYAIATEAALEAKGVIRQFCHCLSKTSLARFSCDFERTTL